MRDLFVLVVLVGVQATIHCHAQNWIQKGQDIDGEWPGDWSGYAVSMPDTNTVAIGALNNSDNGTDAGQVRVYAWNGGAWLQKGADMDGESAGDHSGRSVSMPDANTVAIGSYTNSDNGTGSGHVRVFAWDGGAWVQKGVDIEGEAADNFAGWAISMPDANTVAIGATRNGFYTGHVRIYSWDGSAWIQQGADINGEANADQSGWSVSMPDPGTVAIGSPYNSGAGHVRVYEWGGLGWVQKGGDIDAESVADGFGYSVSMPDANTVAIGAPNNDVGMAVTGSVRVFAWNGLGWVQKGSDLDGEADGDGCGGAVSMPDANTVAISAPDNWGALPHSGDVRIFSWDGAAWIQQGSDIEGEAMNDHSGSGVSMPDAHTVAIGAPQNDGSGNHAGHVRIYRMDPAGTPVPNNDGDGPVMAYPNPFHDQVTIELGALRTVHVIARNALGKEVLNERRSTVRRMELSLPGPAGIYSVEVRTDDGRDVVLKVAKE